MFPERVIAGKDLPGAGDTVKNSSPGAGRTAKNYMGI